MTTPDAELSQLVASLDEVRRHAAGTIAGLTADQLDRPMVASGWAPRSQVEHLLVNERFWVSAIIAGRSEYLAALQADPVDTWQFDPTLDGGRLAELYLAECVASNDAVLGRSPDDQVAWFPAEQFGGWRIDTVRQVLHHQLVETATHAGHLDIVRELIDGAQWLVLD